MAERVEWIGVATPKSDEQVTFRLMAQMYTELEEQTATALTIILAPRVRSDGTRMRTKGRKDGLSQEYQWGLRTYVVDMTELDARRVLDGPDGYEFRREGDESRQPIIPPEFMVRTVRAIMEAAKHGRPFYTNQPVIYADPEGVMRAYEQAVEGKAERAEQVDWLASKGRLDSRQMHLRQGYLRGERGPKLGEVPLQR